MDYQVFRSKLEEILEEATDDDLVDLYNVFAQRTDSVRIYYIWEAEKFGFVQIIKKPYFIISETGAPKVFGDLLDPVSPFVKDKLIDDIVNAFSDPAFLDEKEKTKMILNPYVFEDND